MGRLGKIEKIVNDTISHYGHVKILPRGLPRFVDPLLRGNIRFAKRSGNTISLINVDNTYAFAIAPQIRDNKFILSKTNKWISEDCIVSMGPERELLQVYDVVDTTVLLVQSITQTYTINDKVMLHSYPMYLSGDVLKGTNSIVVKSHYDLANGDTFVYLQNQTLLQSLAEVKISKATKLGTTGDSFYNLLYLLELESTIQKDIASNTLVYFRAYPAYFSQTIRVPNALFTSEPIGPFLLDILSGRLTEGQEFKETFSIRTLNRNSNYTFGTSTSYVKVDKNYLILSRTMPVHSPMFWELAEGSMRLTPSRIVFKVNSTLSFDNTGLIPYTYDSYTGKVQYLGSVNFANVDIGNLFRDGSGVEYKVTDVSTLYDYITIVNQVGGLPPSGISTALIGHLDGSIRVVTNSKFCAGTKCIPVLSGGQTWKLNLLASEDCSIRFIFTPNDPQEFSLISGKSKGITITIPSENDVTNMEINITSEANTCTVQMSEWSPAKDTVEQIEYSFVVEATGTAVYQASGIIIKPYFMGSEFLKTNYDIDSTYDSGKVYL